MSTIKHIVAIVLLGGACAIPCKGAVTQERETATSCRSCEMSALKEMECLQGIAAYDISASEARPPQYLPYEIVAGDTVYIDVIRPSVISSYGHYKGKEWRRYYRLVWNFNKTYPYALVAKKLVEEADSTFAKNNYGKRKRDRYVNTLQKELFTAFGDQMRHMTVTQGQLLMKLIDRETGIPPYAIIKDYKNGIAAGFWQGVARVFGSDLKKSYEPDGEDRQIEELVKKWQSGEFPALYFSIFGEYPKQVEIPSKYM